MIKLVISCLLISFIFLQQNQIEYLNHSQELYQDAIETQAVFINDMVDDIKYMKRYKIPYEYLQLVQRECATQGVDPDFITRLMYVESMYDKRAISPKNAYGLMQLLYSTACDVDSTLTSYRQLFNPEINIRIGIAYFKQLLDYYGGEYQFAAIAYNRGIGRLDSELALGGLIDWYYVKIESIETVQ